MPRNVTDRPVRAADRQPPPPLDGAALERLALHYVGRYATTRAKLHGYLTRKVKERGWAGEGLPPVDGLVDRCAELGYVDDRQFAASRAAALGRRGYGARRVGEALRAAGIAADDAAPAQEAAGEQAWASAVAFARRRRLGPFAATPADDPDRRRKALSAMLRAGHDMSIARRLLSLAPGDAVEDEEAG